MQRQTVSACCLVALVVASTVAATAPAAAAPTAGHFSSQSAAAADDVPDGEYDQTAFLALAGAGDGAVVAAGQTGLENPNGTLQRVDADGATEWTTRFESPNATRVVDVVVTSSDEVYFLLSERSMDGPRSVTADLSIGKASEDGDVLWRESLNVSAFGTRGTSLVESDDGVTVAHRLPEDGGVRLAEYSGSDTVWERTYGVDAMPSSLQTTEDGYLLVGSANFDDPWVLRTSESGRAQLNETYEGIESGRTVGAVATDDGGVLLAGQHRPGFSQTTASAWSARIDSDGVTQWTRVYSAGSGVRISRSVRIDDGLLLVGQGGLTGDESTRLIGIGTDGAQLFDESTAEGGVFTAVARTDDALTVAGVTGLTRRNVTGTLESLPIPRADLTANPDLDAHTGFTSNETVYRGQNVRLANHRGTGEAYHLVRVPGEYDEFDSHAVRRIDSDGEEPAVVESATLPPGEYVLETTDGQAVAVEDGRVTGATTRDEAAFRVDSQRFYGVETNRTFVDVAGGERGVSLTFQSRRTDYDVYVSAERHAGDAVDADALRDAFGDDPRFAGVETVDGQAVARFSIGERERINASVDAFGPGLYDVTVAGVDAADGGAVADGRVVVGSSEERPLGLDLETDSLTVASGQEARTNLTLTNVTRGVAAISMSANRSGQPAVRLSVRPEVNATRVSASAHVSQNETETSGTAINGQTANGSVQVGALEVIAKSFGRESIGNGTTTVNLSIDWVVDEQGVPYTVPDGTTVQVTVTDAENATSGGGGDGAAGGEQRSGSDDGSDSESGTESESGSGSVSASGSESGTDTESESETDTESESGSASDSGSESGSE